MNEEQIAQLRAELDKLKKENEALKAKNQSAEHDEAIKAKDAKIVELETQLENQAEQIKANAAEKADAAIKAAVARGALPSKDEALQAKWRTALLSNPDAYELLSKLEAPASIKAGRITQPTKVEITKEDPSHALVGYTKAENPLEAGRIYTKDIDPILAKGHPVEFARLARPSADGAPIMAANTLGTLVGNIITQRTLALVVSRRPMLRDVVADFSDEVAAYNQNVITRAIGLPSLTNLGNAATDTSDTDYSVQLSNLKQVRFEYTGTEYMGTHRNIVAEHADALATALGNGIVDAIAANITTNFSSNATVTNANYALSTIGNAASTLNVNGAPDVRRNAWIASNPAKTLRAIEQINRYYDRDKGQAYAVFQNIEGFENVREFPALPTTSNLTGFFFAPDALILAMRIPRDPEVLIGAGYPGTLNVVTDPVTGMSVLSNQWVDADTLEINDRLISLYGTAEGVLTAGYRTKHA